tara:strand:- start:248 stop:601 length:354 start_codon:yes stop_codon:yes gene_type:complete
MTVFIQYYLLTLIFYIFEIIIFKFLLNIWIIDIFWLNISIRVVLVSFFSITIRSLLFKESKNFYMKFLILVTINPFISSLFLKILVLFNGDLEVIINKIIADLFTSLIMFFLLKKIA